VSKVLCDNGVIVAVDFNIEGDFAQIVIPLASTDTGDPATMCADALLGFETTMIPLLQACMADTSSVIGLEVHGMVPGCIPARRNYAIGANAGSIAGDSLPSNVGGICDFYFDPSDVSPGNKTKVSHNTVPGLMDEAADGKTILGATLTALESFAQQLVTGYTGGGVDTLLWKRVHAVVKTAGETLLRIAIQSAINAVVGSVRRRLKP